MDLDQDGRLDIISGSWPGEIYLFRRRKDRTFDRPVTLTDKDGHNINVGSASSTFAVDWDEDGDLDLLVGTLLGNVYLVPNQGRLRFGEERQLRASGRELSIPSGDAAPIAADWDADGKLDLIVGSEDGSVVWFRNVGKKGSPRLGKAQTLIPTSPVGWKGDSRRNAGQWGVRTKPCAVDWNGDGRLDLLVGDYCGGFKGKADQTPQEKVEEKRALLKLPEVRKRWSRTYQAYRKLLTSPEPESEAAQRARAKKLQKLRATLQRYSAEIEVVQKNPGTICAPVSVSWIRLAVSASHWNEQQQIK